MQSARLKEFNAIIEKPGFFADLDVFPDAVEVTKRLQNAGHQLYFVTATPYGNSTGGYDKWHWVEHHFPHIGRDRVIQAHHKQMVKGDLLFDDSLNNLRNFPGIQVVMDMPGNRNTHVDHRVTSWLEFERCIETICTRVSA